MSLARALLLLVLVGALSATAAWAELSTDIDTQAFLSTFGPRASAPGDDDPFIWPVVRLSAFSWYSDGFLNPFGVDRRDGRPAFAISPLTGRPVVVWSRDNGHNYDVVMSRWDGERWMPPQIVAAEAMDEVDPSVAVDGQGGIHVVWWRQNSSVDQPDEVCYARYDWRGEFVGVDRIAGERRGRAIRPDIAIFKDEVRVAYEQQLTSGETALMTSRRPLAAKNWIRERVAQTPSVGPNLDGNVGLRIHATGGSLWIDWIDAPGLMAWSVADPKTGGWSAPAYDQYQLNAFPGDSELLAQESARARIRLRVIQP